MRVRLTWIGDAKCASLLEEGRRVSCSAAPCTHAGTGGTCRGGVGGRQQVQNQVRWQATEVGEAEWEAEGQHGRQTTGAESGEMAGN